VRRLVLLSLVTGCAFNPAGENASDDDVAPIDGATATTDASNAGIDALPSSIDANSAWPCGGAPPAIPATVTTGTDVAGAISLVSIAGGGNTFVAQPGQQLNYTLAWSLVDADFFCPTCQDQVEVGLVAGGRHGCVYDANPPNDQPQTGVANVNMTAPMTSGIYSLRFQIARDMFGCNGFGRTGWWISEPSADKTFNAAMRIGFTQSGAAVSSQCSTMDPWIMWSISIGRGAMPASGSRSSELSYTRSSASPGSKSMRLTRL
jgi:hypothetical protein